MMLWWSELDLQKPVGPNDCESLSSVVSTILPLPSEDQIYLILSGKGACHVYLKLHIEYIVDYLSIKLCYLWTISLRSIRLNAVT